MIHRILPLGIAATLATFAQAQAPAGAPGGPGLVLQASKVLVCSFDGEQVVDNAIVLIKDGKVEHVAPRSSGTLPVGYVVRDLGALWVMPGMIDLHSHIGGTGDINDMVYVTNPELRVNTSVVPANPNLSRAVGGAVTSVLFIPGSGTNAGGQGVLIKTGPEHYEDALIRSPGSLKVAQWGNPERWVMGVGKTWENWHLRDMFKQGRAYAARWQAYADGKGPKPERDIRLDLFRDLYAHKTQVSVHTQVAQVVMMTIMMIRCEFKLDVYLDHSTLGGYKYAEYAVANGVPAVIGPRSVDNMSSQMIGWIGLDTQRMQGIAAGYQERGMRMIAFNTDATVIPQEELFLQSALGVRYGFDNSHMDAVRGHTIVPAKIAGIDGRIGSLEPGKDADLVVISGDPSDPRSSVEMVMIDGRITYDTQTDPRRF